MSEKFKPLVNDMDAVRWAKEFNAFFETPLNEQWLISWFSNAIMCGYDKGRSESQPTHTEAELVELVAYHINKSTIRGGKAQAVIKALIECGALKVKN